MAKSHKNAHWGLQILIINNKTNKSRAINMDTVISFPSLAYKWKPKGLNYFQSRLLLYMLLLNKLHAWWGGFRESFSSKSQPPSHPHYQSHLDDCQCKGVFGNRTGEGHAKSFPRSKCVRQPTLTHAGTICPGRQQQHAAALWRMAPARGTSLDEQLRCAVLMDDLPRCTTQRLANIQEVKVWQGCFTKRWLLLHNCASISANPVTMVTEWQETKNAASLANNPPDAASLPVKLTTILMLPVCQ